MTESGHPRAGAPHTRLPLWQQILTVMVLAGLGLLVIAIKVLTH